MEHEEVKNKINEDIKNNSNIILEMDIISKWDLSKFDGKKMSKRFTNFLNWKQTKTKLIKYCGNSNYNFNVYNVIEHYKRNTLEIDLFKFVILERINIQEFLKELEKQKQYLINQNLELNKALETIDIDLNNYISLKMQIDKIKYNLNYSIIEYIKSDPRY